MIDRRIVPDGRRATDQRDARLVLIEATNQSMPRHAGLLELPCDNQLPHGAHEWSGKYGDYWCDRVAEIRKNLDRQQEIASQIKTIKVHLTY